MCHITRFETHRDSAEGLRLASTILGRGQGFLIHEQVLLITDMNSLVRGKGSSSREKFFNRGQVISWLRVIT